MNRIFLAFGVIFGLLSVSLLPATVSAGDHTHSHHNIAKRNSAHDYLIMHGYIKADATHREKRMGIMKFQKENGLRETGSLNYMTRKAIMKLMNMPNIVETAIATPVLSTLVTAVKAGELVDVLATGGPFTVFAPTNDAFAKIPSATLSALLTPEKKSDLVNILTYHVVSGKALSTDLVDDQEIKTLQGKTLKVTMRDGKVYINGAQVVMADVKTKNGVVHVIDGVLLP